jgi:chromosomal replication initiator protein
MSKDNIINPYVFPGLRHTGLPKDFVTRMRKMITREMHDITEDFIMETVSYICKVEIDEIKSSKRDRRIVDARCIYIYHVKKYMNKSYVHIGKSLCGRDHTTISFNINKYHAMYKTEELFRKTADTVSKLVEFY